MQNTLKNISPSAKKMNPYSNVNLITPVSLGEKIKPFVSLKILKAGEILSKRQLPQSISGQAVITYVLSGQVDYVDSTGKRGVLNKDDWSWVISGSGMWYSIRPATTDYMAIQLCIALAPALENSLPQSSYIESDATEYGGSVQVLIGHYGNLRSQFANPSLVNYLLIKLVSEQQWIYEIPVNHRVAWVVLVSGSIKVGDEKIVSNQITVLDQSSKKITFCANENSVFVLGSSQEFMHDLVFHKNSAHTSQEALDKGLRGIAEAEKTLTLK